MSKLPSKLALDTVVTFFRAISLMQLEKDLQSFEKRKWIFKLFNPKATKTLKNPKHSFVAGTIDPWDSAAVVLSQQCLGVGETNGKQQTTPNALRAFLSTGTADLAPVKRRYPLQ